MCHIAAAAQLHELIRTDDRFQTLPFIYMTGYTILRLATPLDETGLDSMMHKISLAELVKLVSDLSGKAEKNGCQAVVRGAA
jgi:hypothetical protein